MGSGGVCKSVSAVFDVGLSERLRPLWKQLSAAQRPLRYHAIFAWSSPHAASRKTFGLRPAGHPRSIHVRPALGVDALPWQPSRDPETGAAEYNAHALVRAQEGDTGAIHNPIGDSVDSALKTPGEAYRALAGDLAEAYQGRYRFLIDNLAQWDEETRWLRADLVFSNAELRHLSATQVMALRTRAAEV